MVDRNKEKVKARIVNDCWFMMMILHHNIKISRWVILNQRKKRKKKNNLKRCKKKKNLFQLLPSSWKEKILKESQMSKKKYFWGKKVWLIKWSSKPLKGSTKNEINSKAKELKPYLLQPQQPLLASPKSINKKTMTKNDDNSILKQSTFPTISYF